VFHNNEMWRKMLGLLKDLVWTVIKALVVAGAIWWASHLIGTAKPEPAGGGALAMVAAALVAAALLLRRRCHRQVLSA
jgi:MYXO-CTERM domain-containing protein